ncbi:MAG: RNA-binding S4 domain-containing protein [Actinomycetota bacterium]
MSDAVRIDRWLWSVRLFPSRTRATDACSSGLVLLDDEPVRPARRVKVGDTIRIRRRDHETVVQVVRLIEKRVGAPIAVECYEDLSPPRPDRDPLDPFGSFPESSHRARGQGRPTKRERRETDRLRGRRAEP